MYTPFFTLSSVCLISKYHVYMIGKCPASFHDDFSLAAMCQRKRHADPPIQYSYLMDIPVLSLTTNLTYANIYCARCHADDQELAEWEASFQCNEDPQQYGD